MTPLAPALQNERRADSPRPGGRLVADTAGVSALTVAAKVAGAAKSLAIARSFGTSADLDAFLLAFLIPSFLVDVFCGSLIPALVPAMMESQRGEAGVRAQAQRWCLRVGAAAGSLILLVSLSLVLFADITAHARQTLSMLAIMSPILPLTALANVWRAALNARKHFLVPASSIIVAPSLLIASVLFAGSYGSSVLAWATTLAVIAELAVLAYGMRRAHLALFLNDRRTSAPLVIWREYGYIAVSAALSTGGYFLGQFAAAGLDSGSLSTLNYGTRLTAVLLGIGPAALGVTILPHFAQFAVSRDGELLRRSLIRTLALAAITGTLTAAFLIAGSRIIVQVAFQHGAFHESDTISVAAVQRISLLQLPFVVCSTLLMRALAALSTNRGLLPVSAAALCVYAALNFLLIKPWGVLGLAAATSISQAILCISLLWLVFRNQGRRFQLRAVA